MKKLYLIISILALFILSGCDSKESTSKESRDQDSFKVKDISSGAEYTLKRKNDGFVVEGHESKVIMFDIYATYCPPCQKEAPHLTDLQVKYADKFLIIALNTFEEVTDSYVDQNFRFKYGAYYFITNSNDNQKIIDILLKGIDYKRTIQIPFKVVSKDGIYQNLTDIYKANPDNKYYIGAIESKIIEKDLLRILGIK